MKKVIPVLLAMMLMVSACSLTGGNATETPISDAQMATRVAQLLATMTTPTQEIDFPPTPTAGLPTVILPTEAEPTVATGVLTSTPIVVLTEGATATAQPETPTLTLVPATSTPVPATQAATATITPTPTLSSSDPANTLGKATGSDSMDSAAAWAWPTGEDNYLKVGFSDGKMEMTGLTKYAGWRLPLIAQQVNTYIELTVDSGTCTGKDSYGIIFRVPVLKDPTQGYLYEVTCDGYYRLWKWDGLVQPDGQATTLVAWSQSSLINTGSNQTNRLGVMVKEKTFTLYINGSKLASGSDASFTAGFFGVFVRSVETPDYTVKFDSMRYWENP